jgi:chromosome segregation ATPase
MARHGVDFETVKQAALKLLSKGISPSVQRVRELLGTGSNSTIAEHLKIWREQHAAKKVHHLPASLPPELIASFETLWQTAMEHAEKHLTDVKEALEKQEEELTQEKIVADKTISDLKSQLDSLNQKMDEKTRENQALQTSLAVATERFQNQADEINALKQQHELRLKHLHDEKHQVIDEVNKLQAEITHYKKEISNQTEKQRAVLAAERLLQEESEKRWIQIIDQSRSETKNSQKKYEEIVQKQIGRIEELRSNLTKLQDKLTTTQSTLDHKNETIHAINKQLEHSRSQYILITSELAVLQSRFKNAAKNRAKQSS